MGVKKLNTTRDGFGQAILELGSKNAQVVVLSADLTASMRVSEFQQEFPKRFLEMGVQEENMVGLATGLALENQLPFVCSYSVFLVNNALGPIRASVCYTNANVKLIGGHAGITTGPDGATHQALEDIATLRVLPNMTVVVPADYLEAKQATYAIAQHQGPCYLRIGKFPTPKVTQDDDFQLGKARIMHSGEDVTVVACGNMVSIALETAKKLAEGSGGDPDISVEVINMHTIKPLDKTTLLNSLKKTRTLITIEEHQIIGGLGSACLEAITTNQPQLLTTPAVTMGVADSFGQSGQSQELLKHYHLDQTSLELTIKKVVNLKNKYEK